MIDVMCMYIILGLVTWRITSLLVNEDGPRQVFSRFRYFIGVRYDQFSVPYGRNVVANALTCMWCTSVWVGFFIGLALRLALAYFSISHWLMVGMSIIDSLILSAIAIMFQEQLE